jgi:hypothetical protein
VLAALLPMGAVAVAAVCGALGHNHRYKRGRKTGSVADAPAGMVTSSSLEAHVC